MRWMMAALALGASAPVLGQPAGQSDEQTCLKEGGDAEWRITACTNRLKLTTLTPHQRAQAYYLRAESLGRSGDFKNALSDLDAALRLKVDSADRESLLVLKARVLAESKATTRALVVADEAVAVRDGLEGRYWRAVLRADNGDNAGAVADLDNALRRNLQIDVREDLLVLKSRLIVRLKDMARALAVAEEAVAVRGGAKAYAWRGELKSDKGDYRAALTDFDRANAAGSKDADSWNNACWTRAAHLNIEIDKARADCARALELAPATAMILDSAGLVELRQGNFGTAWRFYDRAAKVDPKYATALYGRGLASLKLGRTSEGNGDIAAAVRLKPEIASDYAKRGLKP